MRCGKTRSGTSCLTCLWGTKNVLDMSFVVKAKQPFSTKFESCGTSHWMISVRKLMHVLDVQAFFYLWPFKVQHNTQRRHITRTCTYATYMFVFDYIIRNDA